jgi:hypothetical protein
MFTAKSVAILVLLLVIVVIASWSKLRFIDPQDHQQQRWRIDQYPGFMQKKSKPITPTLNGQKSDKHDP